MTIWLVCVQEVIDMVEEMSDYHNLGVQALPFGIEPNLIGDTVLPKIQDYCQYLEHQIFVGMFTTRNFFKRVP